MSVHQLIIGSLNKVFQDTNKQVKDSDFPSITICTEGINMDAVVEAISADFDHWLRVNKNVTTEDGSYNEEEHKNDLEKVLFTYYSFHIPKPTYLARKTIFKKVGNFLTNKMMRFMGPFINDEIHY